MLSPGDQGPHPRRLLLPRVKKSLQEDASKQSPATGYEYKPRAGKPKVRTGCFVCKIRRVKCDEGKPECAKCTSTGRKCEGYAVKSTKSRPDLPSKTTSTPQPEVSPSLAIQSNPSSPSDMRFIHVFCLISGNDFSQHFQLASWTQTVLQSAHAYPTVRCSLNAVSSLYEVYLRNEHKSHKSQAILDTQTSQLALAEYTKAVNVLSKDLMANRLPCQPVLICCLLFVWLEFLRNDFITALRHLKSGLSILEGIHNSSSPSNTPPFGDIDDSILYIFTRLQLQATIHGCPSSDFNLVALKCPLEATIGPVPPLFLTLVDARRCLDMKLISTTQFIRRKQNFERQHGPDAPLSLEWAEMLLSRDLYLSEFEQWQNALQNSPNLMTDGSISEPGVLSLKVDHRMAVMMMKMLFAETEMAYDNCNNDFRCLLTLSEQLLHHSARDTTLPTLSLDSAVIPSLFYITLKCREPNIRHRAMLLLGTAPEREGIWHRDTMFAAAAWKIAMEESCNVESVGGSISTKPIRIYREMVTDATSENEIATVRFSGGPEGSCNVLWEINGLLSQLGDFL
ncbi:hypothetical protein BGZ61DRAFT_512776 [Ilyonectria robusta]|uniref:uncharacterized protein n=1 Tax=Ilyonectria robusta TaxID=1079257 RepID=UPI001E8EE750|nr:uncharacterized protein BGZ61DRAFT_512776 [Ilyonectria robusta]KAH8738410.1 hypothetical protein BGZ61DRAFT_512776 [Ilyonectria robusta]